MDEARPDLLLARLRTAYAEGRNLVDFMRSEGVSDPRAILFAYELQSGSYTRAMANAETRALKERIGAKLARWVTPIEPASVCEAGVGEASTLGALGQHLEPNIGLYGFDASVSRVGFARRWTKDVLARDVTLFCADIAQIPFADHSIDVVYTYHALEPNGGRERELLSELVRVCARRLILVEPSHELGGTATAERIEQLRYVRDLAGVLAEMGVRIVHHRLWELDANPRNRAALIVADFDNPRAATKPGFVSPLGRAELSRRSGAWYSQAEGFAFPIIDEIPVLKRESAVLAAILDPD